MTDLSNAVWRKSSFSGSGNNCVEVAGNLTGLVAVRDSKHLPGPALIFTSLDWQAFLESVSDGRFGA